jgi:hypothetical protein
MRKLINTLLLGLLCLNLYAQTDKTELNPKRDKTLYPKVFEYIRDTLLGGYPIGGTEKDMQRWVQGGFGKRFDYQDSNYGNCFFYVKNNGIFGSPLVQKGSGLTIVNKAVGRDTFVQDINMELMFPTTESAITFYENVVLKFNNLYKLDFYSSSDAFEYQIEQGSFFITCHFDTRVTFFFSPNEKSPTKTVAPNRFLTGVKPIKIADVIGDTVEISHTEIPKKAEISTEIKNENNKNPNCQNRCLRFDGENDRIYFSPFAYKGSSVEVLIARPKLPKNTPRPELTGDVVNFTSILKIDYRNIKDDAPATEGIIELGYIDGSLYLHHIDEGKIDEGKEELIYLNKTIERGEWHHLAIVKDERAFCLFFDGEYLNKCIEANENGVKKMIRDFELTPYPNREGQYFEGYLDEFRIWNRVLADFEIKEYAFQTIKKHPDLLYNCHFDEGVPYADNTTRKYITNSGMEQSGMEFRTQSDKKGDVSNYVCSDLQLTETAVWSLPTVGTGQLGAPDMVVYDFYQSLRQKNDGWKKYVKTDANGKIAVSNIRLWTEMTDVEVYTWEMYYHLSPDGNKAEVRVHYILKSRKVPELETEGIDLILLQKINGVWKIVACPG